MNRRQFLYSTGGMLMASAIPGVMAGARPGGRTRAAIRMHNGAPTLFINDTPHSAFSYMSYGPNEKYYRDFGEAGVNLYSMPASGDALCEWGMTEVWKGPNEFDYSAEDKQIEMVLSGCPNAYLFPRLHSVGPQWWVKKHPEEIVSYIDDNGERKPLKWQGLNFPSWASKKGMAICEEAVSRYVQHVRAASYANHIIGYHVCSFLVGEWMTMILDSSKPMTERYRAFLEAKYRKVDALRKAWGNSDVTFSSAECPLAKDIATPPADCFYALPKYQPVLDYFENYADVVSDAVVKYAMAAKKACDDESLVGSFYGYMLEFGPYAAWHGHTAFRKLLESPSLDFFSSPTSYARRSLTNGSSYFMSPSESVKLHGKMWWDENDYRTFLTPTKGRTGEEFAQYSEESRRELFQKPPFKQWRGLGVTETVEESISHQQRQVAHCISRASGMWWFDMGGGWFDDRKFMKAIGDMFRVAQQSIHFDRAITAEIAVVVDAPGLRFAPIKSSAWPPMIVDQMGVLGRIGAPVSFYLLEDIDKAPDHKVWFFLYAVAPTEAQVAAIEKKVKRNGQVAVWVYAPGALSNGALDLERASALTGVRLAMKDVETPGAVAVTEAAHPLTTGLFETVYGVSGAVGGRLREQLWKGEDVYRDRDWQGRYAETLCRPAIFANDPDAKTLGYLTGLPEPGLVVKGQGDWTSVYSSAGPLSVQLLRNLARSAGAHLYVETDDVVYANKSFLAISTNAGGARTVRLPRTCDVVDAYTGETVAEGVSEFNVTLAPATTRLFYLGTAAQWRAGRS